MTESNAKRILVIDDEVTQRILVKEYLEEAGYVVRQADDGRRGLKMASTTSPDLIILDLMLPSLDGYTLCTCLKQAPGTAHIPIILVTASREHDVIERGLAAGADDFVTKPVDWVFLADRVAFVLARSKCQRELAHQLEVIQGGSKNSPVDSGAAVAEVEARFGERIRTLEEEKSVETDNVRRLGRIELDTAQCRHSKQIEIIQTDAAAKLESLRQSAAAELKALEQLHAEALDAARMESEARLRELKDASDNALKAAEAAHSAEIRTLREEADLQLRSQERASKAEMKALESNFANRIESLRSESAQQMHALKAFPQDAGGMTDHSPFLSAEAGAPAGKVHVLPGSFGQGGAAGSPQTDVADQSRACWDFSRVASVVHIAGVEKIIALATDAVRRTPPKEADQGMAGALRAIEREALDLAGSLGNLRLLAQVMSGKAEINETTIDLVEFVAGAAERAKALVNGKKIDVRAVLPQGTFLFRGDEPRLAYALFSLFVNSARFTPPGGSITLTLATAPDGSARIEIADTGIGISPVKLERMRTCVDLPVHMLASDEKTVGFGIPVATALIRQHGGRLEIDSRQGGGTRAAMVLPPATTSALAEATATTARSLSAS